MKFAFATVFTLALAMGVQSSYLPLAHSHLAEFAGHGLSYTAVSAPHHGHLLAHAPAAVALHESPALYLHSDLHGDLHAALHHDAHHAALLLDDGAYDPHHHLDYAHHDHAHLAHAHLAHAHLADAHLAHAHLADAHLAHAHLAHAHLAPAHEAHYLAENRGALHSAPLPGHLASAAAINLAPAPGTL